MPGLPPHYRAQPDRLRKLREALLIDLQKPVVVTGAAARVGVEGMAGIGKSVLAAALARDLEIRRAFPDGIFWVGVGQLPQDGDAQRQRLAELQRHVARELGHEALFNDPQVGKQALRDLLADGKKAVLLILDDVWQRAAADAFDVAGPRCRLLLTTRDAGLVTALAGTDYQVQLPSEAEALALLASTSGSTAEDLPEQARQVVAQCGRLPLALALCGGMLRSGTPWGDLLDALREHELEFLADDYAAEAQHQNIARALELSIHVLPEDKQRRFAELAVFPEDAEVPEAAVLTLWGHTGGLSERHARQLLLELKQRSVVQWNQRLDGSAVLSLHDLMHHLATRMAVRLFDSLAVLHRHLLDAYMKKCPGGWPTGPDDSYFFQSLPWHLNAARREDDLTEVLTNCEWLEAKLRATNILSLLLDCALPKMAPHFKLISDALRLSARVVEHDPSQLAGQLIGRLLSSTREYPAVKHLLDTARARRMSAWLEPRHTSLTAPGTALICTLVGHDRRVSKIAMSTDGRRAASVGGLRLKVWDLECGMEVKSLPADSFVNCLATTGDGRLILSAGEDHTILVRDLEQERILHILRGHEHAVTAVAVTADGCRAVSASQEGTVKLWNVVNGHCLRTLAGISSSVIGLNVTSDGRRAASASEDGTVRVWNLENGQELRVFHIPASGWRCVAVSADGNRAVLSFGPATDSFNHSLQVWNLETGRILRTLWAHEDWIEALTMTSDGQRALSGSADCSLKLWNLECERDMPAQPSGHDGIVSSVAVTRKWAVSASRDGTLKVWNWENGQEENILRGHDHWVFAVALTRDGRRIVSGGGNGLIKIWDLVTGHEVCALMGHVGQVRAVAVTTDGRLMVSASDDHTIKVWDLESGRELRTLRGHTERVMGVAVTPDGRQVVSASFDETLKVWDLESGQTLRTLRGHNNAVTAVAVTPDARRAVSASYDHTLRMWDLASGHDLQTLRGHNDIVWAVAVTADGRHLLSTSGRDKRLHGNTLKVWSMESGMCLCTFTGETAMRCCACAADSRTIVAGNNLGHVDFFKLVLPEDPV